MKNWGLWKQSSYLSRDYNLQGHQLSTGQHSQTMVQSLSTFDINNMLETLSAGSTTNMYVKSRILYPNPILDMLDLKWRASESYSFLVLVIDWANDIPSLNIVSNQKHLLLEFDASVLNWHIW